MAEPNRPSDASSAAPPRPPNKPEPYECCGRHCSPCIMDYYWDALARWEDAVRALGRDPESELKTLGRVR